MSNNLNIDLNSLLLILLVCSLIAVAYRLVPIIVALAALLLHKDKRNIAQITGGKEKTKSSTPPPSLLPSTQNTLTLFLSDRLTADLVALAAQQLADLPASQTLDATILEVILDFYIYTKDPNQITRADLTKNIQTINNLVAGDPAAIDLPVAQLNSLAKIATLPKSPEERIITAGLSEAIRGRSVYKLNYDQCAAEIVKLKTALATAESNSLRAQTCEREKSDLTLRVYELRREIDRCLEARYENKTPELQQRLYGLQATNNALQQQVNSLQHQLQTSQLDMQQSSIQHTAQLNTELANCKKLLDEVLNAI